ncbi:hypothetical protein [Flavobacterium sp. AG291]|uniref:hypothetical protein n=1 Tax=Flavobacterium sp. AG291 TaxID=2184000 RepID=UPI000E0BA360|nr:hypothetical protein [Flavobacterium sp. AG291]RDI07030.1 hypothetical protein DEU42_113130 [Flavobacterium sp. AG291]
MNANVTDKSLELNKGFVESLTAAELNDLMKEFDDYEIERCNSGFYSHDSVHEYLYKVAKLFNKEKRKSVNLKDNEEDLNKVLSFYN